MKFIKFKYFDNLLTLKNNEIHDILRNLWNFENLLTLKYNETHEISWNLWNKWNLRDL